METMLQLNKGEVRLLAKLFRGEDLMQLTVDEGIRLTVLIEQIIEADNKLGGM